MSNQDTKSTKSAPAHDSKAVLKWQTRVQKGKHPAGKEVRKRHVDVRLIGTRPKVPGRA